MGGNAFSNVQGSASSEPLQLQDIIDQIQKLLSDGDDEEESAEVLQLIGKIIVESWDLFSHSLFRQLDSNKSDDH